MKEIVTIQLGACGCNLGYKFWEDVCDEHGILPTGTWCGDHQLQLAKIYCLFRPGPVANYVPRTVMVDLDSSVLDNLRANPFGRIFNPDNMIFTPQGGGTGSGNNFAKCFHTLGPNVMEDVVDVIRKEAESCDWITGFQMINSLGGGTGSGMQALLLPVLRKMFPKTVLTNFCVCPSAKISDTVVEPYNSMLAFPSLLKYSDLTILLDNEALYDICNKTLRLSRPTYPDINYVMAKTMSGLSATYRFPARNHVSWRVLKCLAPHERMHFYVPGFVPLASRAVQPFTSVTVDSVASQMLNSNILMASVNKNAGKYISAAALFRGCIVSEWNVNETLCRYEKKNSSQFVDWMPFHFMKGICVTPPRGLRVSCTFIANHTSIAQIWGRVLERYHKLIKRKAFVHWFTGEGMTMEDFQSAERSMQQLIKDYRDAEAKAPQGWKSPMDNPVVKKVLKEEKLVRVVDIVTVQPKFAVMKVFRKSLDCVQIFGCEGGF